jgi:hypothetical protein
MMTKTKKPANKTEVRTNYGPGARYRVEVREDFDTREEALAFAKTLGQPIVETADTFD